MKYVICESTAAAKQKIKSNFWRSGALFVIVWIITGSRIEQGGYVSDSLM
jgi:hypothetical protein